VSLPLRRRPWFQDAYIRCAALIMIAVMSERTPSESVEVIEGQLERAYKNGRRDERADNRHLVEAARAEGLRTGHDTLLEHVKKWRVQDHYARRAVIEERIALVTRRGLESESNTTEVLALQWVLQQIDAEEHYYADDQIG
jgi:hypothetical protein